MSTIPNPPPLPSSNKDVIMQAANTLKSDIKSAVESRLVEDSNKTFGDLGTGEVYMLMNGLVEDRDDTTTIINYLSLKPELRDEYNATKSGAKSLITTLENDDNIEILDDGTVRYTDKAITDLEEQLLDDIELAVEETVIPKQPPKRRSKKIGAEYEGLKTIKSRKGKTINNVEYYIPDSVDCALKCYQLAFDIEGIDIKLIDFVKEYNKKFCGRSDGISVLAINTILKKLQVEHKNISPMKMCYLYGKDKNLESNAVVDIITSKHTGKIGDNYYTMGLLYIGNDCYHAVLYKTDNLKSAGVKLKDINIEFCKSKKIVCDSTFLPNVRPTEPKRYIVVYDVETYVDENMVLHPVTLGWGIVDLYTQVDDKVEFIFNDDDSEPIPRNNRSIVYYEVLKNYESSNDLYKQFFVNCEKYIVENKIMDSSKGLNIQVFAHNGGKFDHTFINGFTDFEFKNVIKNGNQIKSGTITLKNHDYLKEKTKFILKDSLLFSLSSLKNSCKFLGCTLNKKDINIVDKDLDWFKNNEYHLEYLKYDILSLAEMVFRLNVMTSEFGMSITNFIGLPGMAYHLMRKSCKGLDKVELSTSPSLNKFISECTYGGRVLRWETVSDKELISLDYNSLYPSSMYAATFPVGKCKNITKLPKSHNEFLEFDSKAPHYMIEAEIDIPNIKRPYHPYKKVTRLQHSDTIKTCLVYPSNQVIVGCYNDVDIREMVKDGYKILNVRRGIYWSRSNRIFSDLVEVIYNMRAELKKLPSSDPRRPKEYLMKILLNAMYGKFNETIRESVKYSDEDNIKIIPGCKKMRSKQLENGQYETIIKNFYPSVKKPTQIASYILSYSRALMNELIRKVGPNNIHYSDTDSIYIPKDIYFNSEELMSFSHSGLCGYKNDYGEGVYITKSIFLDMKRYYLEKNVNGKKEYTVKFNGLHYGGVDGIYSIFNSEQHRNKAVPRRDSNLDKDDVVKVSDDNRDSIFYNIFMQLYNENYIKKDFKAGLHKVKLLMSELQRTGRCIKSVHSEVIFGISPHSRGQSRLVGDYVEFGGLGYDWDKEEYIPELIRDPSKFKMGDLQRECSKYPVIRIQTNVDRKNKLITVKSKLLPLMELDTKKTGIVNVLRCDNLISNFVYSEGDILGCIKKGDEYELYELGIIGMSELLDNSNFTPDYILGVVFSPDMRDTVQKRYGSIALDKNDKAALLTLRNIKFTT